MVDGGDAELDALEVLVGEVDVRQRRLQQAGVLGRLAVAAVGEALAGLVGVGEFALLAPGAAVDELVDVGAVGALGVGEDAQARGLDVDAHPLGVGQRVGADEVVRRAARRRSRRVKAASASSWVCSGSRSRKMPERVITTSMRGRPRSASGTRSAPAEPAVGVEAGHRADQRQRLGDRAAVGLDAVRPPEHQRHRVRQAGVGVEQPLGLARAVLHREGGGHAERVEGVDVAPGGQDVAVADQVAARAPAG